MHATKLGTFTPQLLHLIDECHCWPLYLFWSPLSAICVIDFLFCRSEHTVHLTIFCYFTVEV